jgi:16S rRNA (cytosine1402-N4)-methyltransferase
MMELPETGHDAVLVTEVLALLRPAPGEIFVDCTLGRAGHAALVAQKLGAEGQLIGIDADERNLEFARQRLADAPCRVRLFHANFSQVREVLSEAGVNGADGLLADLGLSTNQLLHAGYGLSFAQDMPLDMRLDPQSGPSAADLVNTLDEEELANTLFELAQERYSRRIARVIVAARKRAPIRTTGQLADLVKSVLGSGRGDRIDPATRTFLALRMAVNKEMDNLQALLDALPAVLRAGGRAGVISFQSMEDRLVKQAFRKYSAAGTMEPVTRKPVVPAEAEAVRNPRSRSSKLRVAVKLEQRVPA